MEPLFFSPSVQEWFELFLLWVGFGTCVGLLAKAIMPGRDPGGAVATLLMGITGVIIGCGVYTLVYDSKVSPITSVGLICGTLGAIVILAFYRLLGGLLLDEGGQSVGGPVRREGERMVDRIANRRRRRRRYEYLDD